MASSAQNFDEQISLVEATIQDLSNALESGNITATEIVAKYLLRIAKYDWNGARFNSIPMLNEDVFAQAVMSDDRRAAGHALGVLEGIPYTIKDNFAVSGMTAAAGSPAFKNLRPVQNSFVAEYLGKAGAILIGRTNMPPMARGGMERGLFGRAESPYNSEYLTAAFASGSSNGSATSTTASFAAFGIGTETVSSGRSPASNNALVAYTPSRGVISCRGLWPLYATCDVVTPHTRTLDDMYRILPVLRIQDPSKEGDFWRQQTGVALPPLPAADHSVNNPSHMNSGILNGKTIGVPKMFIGVAQPDVQPTYINQSVLDLWKRAKADLESMGASVIETDFPVLSNYEKSATSTEAMNVPGCTPDWIQFEREELMALTWEHYLQWSKDPNYPDLQSVDPGLIFPKPDNYLPDKHSPLKSQLNYSSLIKLPNAMGNRNVFEEVTTKQALDALEAYRKEYMEIWMDKLGLDFVVFPANGDVGRADLETVEDSAVAAMKDGVKFSNGNRALRHFGIPTVSVSMGLMADTKMPVNLTFAGKAYQDDELLKYAHAFEQHTHRRVPPPLAPSLHSDVITISKSPSNFKKERLGLEVKHSELKHNTATMRVSVHLKGSVTAPSSEPIHDAQVEVFVNGDLVNPEMVKQDSLGSWEVIGEVSSRTVEGGSLMDYKNPPSKTMVVILAKSSNYRPTGQLLVVDPK